MAARYRKPVPLAPRLLRFTTWLGLRLLLLHKLHWNLYFCYFQCPGLLMDIHTQAELGQHWLQFRVSLLPSRQRSCHSRQRPIKFWLPKYPTTEGQRPLPAFLGRRCDHLLWAAEELMLEYITKPFPYHVHNEKKCFSFTWSWERWLHLL